MNERLLDTLSAFAIYFVELSVLFVVISSVVSVINAKYKGIFERHLSQNSLPSYFKAILLGALTPFCSCSTIPLLHAFLKAKIALGVCVAYLLTSPLINPIIVVMLFIAFGVKVVALYVGVLVILIFCISLFISLFNPKIFLKSDFILDSTPCCESKNKNAKNPPHFSSFSISHFSTSPQMNFRAITPNQSHIIPQQRGLKQIVKESFAEYKKILPYLAIGMAIGAAIHGFAPKDLLESFGDFGVWGVILAAFIGILLYIRVEAIIPIGVALIEIGTPLGVVMSFLIAGAGCSLPELILLKRMFKNAFLAIFVAIVLLIAIGFGILMYLL